MRLAWALLVALSLGCGADAPSPPHGVVLIVLDTLRADRLSAYGNPRSTSPAIDALASEGVLFEHAVSHAAWTLPGFVGLLSGSYPSVQVFRKRLRVSLVERIRESGYTTAAFTEGAYVSSALGMDLGFEHWHEEEGETDLRPQKAGGSGGIESTFAAARAWLADHGDRPFFLLVHTYEVHGPYVRRRFAEGLSPGAIDAPVYGISQARAVGQGEIPVGPEEIEYVRALYDGGVAEADRHVGDLLEALEGLGLADRTLVVLTSDHGELLADRRPEHLGVHGQHVYEPLVHIPLVIRDPLLPAAARRVGTPVRLVDVLPTVLDRLGIEAPQPVSGRSLVPLLVGEEDPVRLAYSEVLFRDSGRLKRAAVRQGSWKLILNGPGAEPEEEGQDLELYDLARDPEERRNLVESEPTQRARLFGRLMSERSARQAEGPVVVGQPEGIDPALRKRLQALGYVE